MKNAVYRYLIPFLFTIYATPALSASPMLDDGVDICHIWVGSMSASRQSYETMVITKALELSEDRYGTCPLMIHKATNGQSHALTNEKGFISEGIYMQTTEQYPPDELPFKGFHWLTNRYLSGLQGYRKIITTQGKRVLFDRVNSVKELKQLRVGLVESWPGTKVFKHNNFNIVGAINQGTIWSMMESGRFDYHPLGIAEVDATLATMQTQIPELVIVPNILLYYSSPVYLIINPENDALANRLAYGFKKMHELGVGDSILKQQIAKYGLDHLEKDMNYFIIDQSPTPKLLKTHLQ